MGVSLSSAEYEHFTATSSMGIILRNGPLLGSERYTYMAMGTTVAVI